MGSLGGGEFWFSAVNLHICDLLEFVLKYSILSLRFCSSDPLDVTHDASAIGWTTSYNLQIFLIVIIA